MSDECTGRPPAGDGADDDRRRRDADDAIADAQAAIDEARRRVAEAPAEVVVTNHVMGLYELAAIHLVRRASRTCPRRRWRSTPSPVSSTGSATASAPTSATLRDALANIRLAFVQIKSPRRTAPDDSTAPDRRTRRRRNRPIGGRRDRRASRRATVTPSARSSGRLPGGRVGRRAAVAAHDPPPRQLESAVPRRAAPRPPGPGRG